jgi:hypothetical protein
MMKERGVPGLPWHVQAALTPTLSQGERGLKRN